MNIGIEQMTGVKPRLREYLAAQAAGMSGDIAINILTADVTPAPTTSAWDYIVKFEIVDSSGNVHSWFSGDITAAASDTSVAGTASVDDTTPPVVNGVGTVTLSGTAASWLNAETAQVDLDATILGVTVTTQTFTVTFTT
jgi:hypothetical protein